MNAVEAVLLENSDKRAVRWTAEDEGHRRWFQTEYKKFLAGKESQLPCVPFRVNKVTRVTDPAKCYSRLIVDCNEGKESPRALYNALQEFLRDLHYAADELRAQSSVDSNNLGGLVIEVSALSLETNLSSLPELPEDKELPELPKLPEDKELPELPEAQELPELPELPEAQELPDLPELETDSGDKGQEGLADLELLDELS